MPHDDYYKEYFAENLAGNYTQAFTGSQDDVNRAKGLFDNMPHYLGGIRLALALIREADYVVANDSGLAHAAAAMKKPMCILWKNTSLPKNSNPNPECKIKMCH
jgi:ADP-heptose:LPS heptosyltransferase